LYIGAYYGGTFWANIPNVTSTESTTQWLDTANKSGVKSYSTIPSLTNAPSNTLSFLFGFADMGIRLSVYTNKRLFSDENFAYDTGGVTTYYKSYESEAGVVTPQIVWSMAKNLAGDSGVKPYVAVDMAFTKNYTKENKYDNASGSWVAEESVTSSNTYTDTKIYAGLGGYTFLNKDGFKLSTDVDYVLTLKDYNNEYNYSDASNVNCIKTGFKGTVDGGGKYTEISGYNTHEITPSVSGQWSGGPLSFRFKVNLPVTLEGSKETKMADKTGSTDGSLVKNGADQNIFSIGFNPDIRLAAQWKIIPKLTLNLGGRINVGSIASKTTESKDYSNDTEVPDSSSKTVANTSVQNPNNVNQFTTGVTFNVTDNFTFEAATGVNSGTVSVFQTSTGGGLFHFTNLLISLKY